jgi:hypothetical protein
MSLPSKRFMTLPLALLPLLLGACVATAPLSQDDTRLQQLVVGMDQCLENQAAVSAQLIDQQGQLEQQNQQLSALREHPAEDRVLSANTPGTGGAEVCTRSGNASGKILVGELEQVWLSNLDLALPARVDTGAETASLDARNIELFERNGRRWVRFEILHPGTGKPLVLERKLKRMVMIVQSSTTEPERRPVIQLGITIGSINQTAEFTLSNRSHLDYQILIGRNILQDVMVVDVSQKNIAPFVRADAAAVDAAAVDAAAVDAAGAVR